MNDLISSSYRIIKEAKGYGCERVIALVSSGKDSVCLFDVVHKLCQKIGIHPFFVHHYIVKNLDIEEEVLTLLEKKYNTAIYRYENAIAKLALLKDMLCINLADDDLIAEDIIKKYRLDTETDRALFNKYETRWMTTGIKKADSVNRRYALNEYPNPNPNKKRFYPLSDWGNPDVREYMKKNNLPLSSLYKISKRSFDSLSVQSVYPIKSFNRKDYDKICNQFPLMDALCWIYEKRAKKYGLINIEKC